MSDGRRWLGIAAVTSAVAAIGSPAAATEPPPPALPSLVETPPPPAAPDPRNEPDSFVLDLGFTTRLIFDPALVFSNGPSSHLQKGIAGAATAIRHYRTMNPFLSLMAEQSWGGTPAFGANVGFPALDITTFTGRALAGLAWRPARSFDVAAGIGAGADHVTAKAGITGGGSAWLIAGRAALRLAVRLPEMPLEAWAAFTVDVRPRAHFAESAPPGAPGGTLAFYNTAPVQPGVIVGIGWRL
jgi:hypothetical protein